MAACVWLSSLMLKSLIQKAPWPYHQATSSHKISSAEAFSVLILSRALAQLALGSSFITAADRGEDFITATAR